MEESKGALPFSHELLARTQQRKQAADSQLNDSDGFGSLSFWTEKWQERGLDRPYSWYDVEVGQVWDTLQRHVVSSMQRQANKPGLFRWLDAGCGNCDFIGSLHNKFTQAAPDAELRSVGVDYSAELVRLLQERHKARQPAITYVEADMTRTPFPDQHFDLIVDKAALDAICCAGSESKRRYISELGRIVKDDGHLLIITVTKVDTLSLSADASKPVRWKLLASADLEKSMIFLFQKVKAKILNDS